jgi:hypothetical protein
VRAVLGRLVRAGPLRQRDVHAHVRRDDAADAACVQRRFGVHRSGDLPAVLERRLRVDGVQRAPLRVDLRALSAALG